MVWIAAKFLACLHSVAHKVQAANEIAHPICSPVVEQEKLAVVAALTTDARLLGYFFAIQ
jgi:hypothetical protein